MFLFFFLPELEALALVTVLVSDACFRAVTRTQLAKTRRLNITALKIPHLGARTADHSNGFSVRGRNIGKKTSFFHVTLRAINGRLNLQLFMSVSYVISTIVLL